MNTPEELNLLRSFSLPAIHNVASVKSLNLDISRIRNYQMSYRLYNGRIAFAVAICGECDMGAVAAIRGMRTTVLVADAATWNRTVAAILFEYPLSRGQSIKAG